MLCSWLPCSVEPRPGPLCSSGRRKPDTLIYYLCGARFRSGGSMSRKLFAQSASLEACGTQVLASGLLRAQAQENQPARDPAPSGRGIGTRQQYGPQSDPLGPAPTKGGNGIAYHGGPLLVNGTNVYYIWYG